MGLRSYIAATALMAAISTTVAASPITYTFTGTGSGTLNNTTPFSGTFVVTDVADTSSITTGGGEVRNTPSSSTFTSGGVTATLLSPLIIENTSAPGFIGFSESVTPFNGEFLTAPVFETYGLSTALALTSGGLSVSTTSPTNTLVTNVGLLQFTSISALSFQASVPSTVPEPAALALFGPALLALGAVRSRNTLSAMLDRKPGADC